MERKTECLKYSECLGQAAKYNKAFNCAKCMNYEEPPETRVDEFEEELRRRQAADSGPPKGREEMSRPIVNKGQTCSVEGCENAANCGGMCWMHYARKRKGAAMEGPPRRGLRRKEKEEPITKTRKIESTKKGRGADKPKAAPGEDLVRYEPTEAGIKLVRLQRTIQVLIVSGQVSEEKVKQAYEIAGWK